jgi:hypothetical protein
MPAISAIGLSSSSRTGRRSSASWHAQEAVEFLQSYPVCVVRPTRHCALGVSFQEVVHPVLNEEAEVVEALANPRRTEWTPIRMRL